MEKVKIKRLTSTAIIPTRGSDMAAGQDLYADLTDKVLILPHNTVKIPTGIAISLPHNTFGGIFARSGLATNKGLRPSNCTGVIDADYRGEIIVALHNDSDIPHEVAPKDRVAQLICLPYVTMDFVETNCLEETARGKDGFGSTGE